MSIKDITPRRDQKNLFVNTTDSTVVTSGTITAGSTLRSEVVFKSDFERLEILNLATKIRVDVDDQDHEFFYPDGVLTGGQSNLDFSYFPNDSSQNDSPVGQRVYAYWLRNNDSSSHEYFLRFKFYRLRESGEVL